MIIYIWSYNPRHNPLKCHLAYQTKILLDPRLCLNLIDPHDSQHITCKTSHTKTLTKVNVCAGMAIGITRTATVSISGGSVRVIPPWPAVLNTSAQTRPAYSISLCRLARGSWKCRAYLLHMLVLCRPIGSWLLLGMQSSPYL